MRIHPTRSWIAILLVAWTRGPARLKAWWETNTPSGRVTVGHRGTFSSSGENWILTRLKETEHLGDFKRPCLDCFRKLLDIDEVQRDGY